MLQKMPQAALGHGGSLCQPLLSFNCWSPADLLAQTMTEALEKFNLSKLDLFAPNVLYDSTLGAQLPPLRFAVYECMGVFTTMFLRDELRLRAAFVHASSDAAEQRKRKKQRDKIIALMHIYWHSPRRVWCPTTIDNWVLKLKENETSIRTLILSERAKIWPSSCKNEEANNLETKEFYRNIPRYLLHPPLDQVASGQI
jgi:hypothetical protein